MPKIQNKQILEGRIGMRYKTDLEAVQSVAKSLLYTTVHETKFSPMVVHHPFTSSAFVAIKRKEEMEMFSILENKENLHKWQDFMSKQISNTENVYQIFMMVNKPYALTFLKFAADNLSFEDFSKILNDAWVMSENPNCDANVSKDELVKFFKTADPEHLMTPEERKRLSELDDSVTIYRGVTSYNADNVYALSWSLDYEKANWFAHRFDEDGTVYRARIDKKNILAFFNGRSEAEVIVDPKDLTEVEEAEEMSQGFIQTM